MATIAGARMSCPSSQNSTFAASSPCNSSSCGGCYEVSVTVKLVGVVGCSASGKSTLSNLLAGHLDTPLYPISTDNFYMEDVCAKLGTFEDFRCIDYARMARWMVLLAHGVPRVSLPTTLQGDPPQTWCEKNVSVLPEPLPDTQEHRSGGAEGSGGVTQHWVEQARRAWWWQIRRLLPEAERYWRWPMHETVAERTNAVGLLETEGKGQRMVDTKVKYAVSPSVTAFSGGDARDAQRHAEKPQVSSETALAVADDDDTSLCAHEAEDEALRRQSVTLGNVCGCGYSTPPSSPVQREGSRPSHTSVVPDRVTVYIVWEGVTLLCNQGVSALLDYAVRVQCDEETACLRRFFRTPRRHLLHHLMPDRAAESQASGGDAGNDAQAVRRAAVARVVRQVYRPRIEQMWTTRSQEKTRRGLRAALQHEMMLDATAMPKGEVDEAESSAGIEEVERLLSLCVFNPPRPGYRAVGSHVKPDGTSSSSVEAQFGGAQSQTTGGAACADACDPGVPKDHPRVPQSTSQDLSCWTEAGVPTELFRTFWEVDFDKWLLASSPTDGALALAWASLAWSSPEDPSTDLMQPRQSQGEEGGGLHLPTGAVPRLRNPPQLLLLPTPEKTLWRLRHASDQQRQQRQMFIERNLASRGHRAVLLGCLSSYTEAAAPLITVPRGAPRNSTGYEKLHGPLGEGAGEAWDGAEGASASYARSIAAALKPFYYEFRYWFYFEVLYYDHLLNPLQAHRLRWRSARRAIGEVSAAEAAEEPVLSCGHHPSQTSAQSPGSADSPYDVDVPRPWWVVKNVSGELGGELHDLKKQVQGLATAMRTAP